MEYDCNDEYEPIVLRGDESPELREALLEFDSVMKAIDEGDFTQLHKVRGIIERIQRLKWQEKGEKCCDS